MKKILQAMLSMTAVVAITASASAQLASGTFAPNFTGTDLDGVEHTLYDYLAEGKTVILDVSATWCGPCWSYHTGGTLDAIWEERGPDGTDDVVVIMIEGDASTGQADLEGSTAGTQGDWITGTHYPIIDDGALSDILEISYYPTLYTVCPNGIISETGQMQLAGYLDFIDNCGTAAEGVDAAILAYEGATAGCGDVDLIVNVASVGTEAAAGTVISYATSDGQTGDYTLETSLAQYEQETVTVGTISVSEDITVDFTLSDDAGMDNNTFSQELTRNQASSTHIRLAITPDCWASEIGWSITDENGTEVAGAAFGTYANAAYPGGETFFVSAFVPVGCYSLQVSDAFGDGLIGAASGFACDFTGSVVVTDVDGPATITFIDYDGSTGVPYAEGADALNSGFDAQTVVSVEEAVAAQDLNIFPNPANDFANIAIAGNAAFVTVDVVSMLGQKVISENFNNVTSNIRLDLTSVENGMYVVNINVDGNVIAKTINVQH